MKRLRTLAVLITATLALSAHAVGRLADITVFDRATNTQLPVHWHEGRAYVVGRPGNEYQVTVRNNLGEDLLAVMSVDGVNVVSGQTASASQGGYVLSPWERMEVSGWRKSLEQTAAFYFTSLGDSYAARTGRPQNVGVIGVALFRRKPVEPPPAPQSLAEPWRDGFAKSERSDSNSAPAAGAAAEASREKRAAAPSAPLGTGHGRRENSQAQYVPFERASQSPSEVVTIHYDSYRNLVALGVLSAPPAPRNPNPFPGGFVPDPVSSSPFLPRYRGA
jgi:hypothetical protein